MEEAGCGVKGVEELAEAGVEVYVGGKDSGERFGVGEDMEPGRETIIQARLTDRRPLMEP